jgi:hypothetical protein
MQHGRSAARGFDQVASFAFRKSAQTFHFGSRSFALALGNIKLESAGHRLPGPCFVCV